VRRMRATRRLPGRAGRLLTLAAATLGLCACSTLGLSGPGSVAVAEPPRVSPPIDEIEGDLGLAKRHFQAAHYGLAELHFRRAAESGKGHPEAWLGLAAAYDKLKRYDLADRAYARALGLFGPTPEYLNNRGYSYLLRGDIPRASRLLAEAALQDPENQQVRGNLAALERRVRGRS
jgi:Flp pilus assembly protein TadD